MPPRKSRGPARERAKTDDSLETERNKTDAALKGDRTSAVREADGVIDHARAVADTVLSVSRRKQDHESDQPQPATQENAVAGERAKADRDVRAERATADVVLRGERKDQAETLTALLVHERATTDAYLLTERSRSDDALAHRDDFLGMVAHDVRNLLHGIVLSLAVLRQGTADAEADPQVSAAARRIQRYVARMNRLIGDLVDVTSIDAGKLAMALLDGDAAALVTEAIEAFQPAALEKGLSLSADVPGGPLLARFDHDRMLQVFANLISNAIKFTPQGGQVDIRVETLPDMLRFCVSDTGAGIPAPMLDAIFERFWQVGKNDKRGQGLGLYISKRVVEAHHGRIWAESIPGQGTQLYFTLPARSSRRSGPRAPTAGRPAPRMARPDKAQRKGKVRPGSSRKAASAPKARTR